MRLTFRHTRLSSTLVLYFVRLADIYVQMLINIYTLSFLLNSPFRACANRRKRNRRICAHYFEPHFCFILLMQEGTKFALLQHPRMNFLRCTAIFELNSCILFTQALARTLNLHPVLFYSCTSQPEFPLLQSSCLYFLRCTASFGPHSCILFPQTLTRNLAPSVTF